MLTRLFIILFFASLPSMCCSGERESLLLFHALCKGQAEAKGLQVVRDFGAEWQLARNSKSRKADLLLSMTAYGDKDSEDLKRIARIATDESESPDVRERAFQYLGRCSQDGVSSDSEYSTEVLYGIIRRDKELTIKVSAFEVLSHSKTPGSRLLRQWIRTIIAVQADTVLVRRMIELPHGSLREYGVLDDNDFVSWIGMSIECPEVTDDTRIIALKLILAEPWGAFGQLSRSLRSDMMDLGERCSENMSFSTQVNQLGRALIDICNEFPK